MDLAYRKDRLFAFCEVLVSERADNVYYKALAGRLTGRVLELGCDKGAAITHLAHKRLELYGLNSAPQMLALVRHHEGDDSIPWHAKTIELFEISGLFRMIFITGHSFECLVRDTKICPFIFSRGFWAKVEF